VPSVVDLEVLSKSQFHKILESVVPLVEVNMVRVHPLGGL